ncbi:MAG: glycosyltransferase family 2 protein [Leptonema sp. (in: bacteria)]
MKEKPFVSIIIPARNEEENIGECIKSLLNQRYENFEIIVVDDNSQDRTPFIVQKLAEKNKNLNYFKIKDKFSGVNNKNLKASTFSNFRVPKPKFVLESSSKNIDDNVE